MDRKYSKAEMKRILRRDISTSALTEQKIQEAYSFVRADAAMKRQTERMYQSSAAAGNVNGREAVRAEEQTTGREAMRAADKRRAGGHRGSAARPGRRMPRRWAALAAAAVLAVSSVTVMAINGMFSKTVEQSEDTLSYKLEFNYELTPNVIDTEPGYVPEGYEQQPGHKLTWCADGSWQNGFTIYTVTANYLDQQSGLLDVDNVENIEKTTINGMEAHLITLKGAAAKGSKYMDKRIYLFNENDGFVCILFGGNDLSMEELVKVAEGLQFTKQEETLEYMSAEDLEAQEKMIEESIAQENEEQQAKLEAGVPQKYIYDVGESFEIKNMFVDPEQEKDVNTTRIAVKSAEVIDSIADYPQENFFNYDEDLAPKINEDGTATSYARVTGDGEDDAEETTENVNRKFLKVTLTAENISDAAIDFWAGAPQLAYLEPVEESNYKYDTTSTMPLNGWSESIGYDGRAIYFDQSPYAGKLNPHFFYRDLEAGETLEYTLLFAVDEDRLENLYLVWGTNGMVIPEEGETYTERYVRMNVG